MGRRIDVDNLVGTAEIARRLGVKRPQVVHDWIRRHKEDSEHPFPKPVAHLSKVKIWNWPDVERWAKQTNRLPARAEA
jgi:transposase-like protein